MTLPVAPPRTSLTDIAAAVQPALVSFLDERRDLVEPVGPVFTEATAGLERFILRGGKRIRPAFAWAGWLAGGGEADGARADDDDGEGLAGGGGGGHGSAFPSGGAPVNIDICR